MEITEWKLQNFTLTVFWQKFRESNGFIIEVDFTKYFSGEREFSFFSNCGNFLDTLWKLRKFTVKLFWQKFRESNGFTKRVTKVLISRKNFQRERISWFFPQCGGGNFAKTLLVYRQKQGNYCIKLRLFHTVKQDAIMFYVQLHVTCFTLITKRDLF